jgi:hypothetical protein
MDSARPMVKRARGHQGGHCLRRFLLALLFGLLPCAAFAQSSESAWNVQCGGIDDTATVEAAIEALATSTTRYGLQVHGHCVMTRPVSQTLHTDVAIAGDGPGATSFTFTQPTDGFSFLLSHAGGHWGGIRLSGLSVIRGPGNPRQANTGISIIADPAAGVGYGGNSGLSDVFVGGNAEVSSWSTGIDLQSVTNFPLRNVNVLGPLPSEAGTDRGIAVSGSSYAMFAVQLDFTDSSVGGFSTGIFVTGYVQGIFVVNGAIIGDWRGIDWRGVGPGTTFTAASTTMPGKPIVVSPADAARLALGMVAEGAGMAPVSRIAAIDAKTGQVTLSPAPTRAVVGGQGITFHVYYVAEALNVTNSTFNATHRDILDDWGAFVQVTNSSLLQFRSNAPDWAAIDLEETNNNTIIGNNILGQFKGNENGIIINGLGGQGHAPTTVVGNVINGVTGAGIQLGGTVRNVVVTGNNVFAAAAAVRSTLPNAISASANRLNDRVTEPSRP